MASEPFANAEYTVHNFSCLSTPTPTPTALVTGREVIQQAVGIEGWRTVNPTFDTTAFDIKGNTYVFSRPIPAVSSAGSRRTAVADLLEWGSNLDGAQDVFCLQDLEEFQSVDLTVHSRRRHPPTEPLVGHGDLLLDPPHAARERAQTPSFLRERKRRRLDTSLYTIVPQPHYHPPPFTDDSTAVGRRLPGYRKAKPLPVPPRDLAAVHEFLNTPYARGAWIVPLRGTLLWAETSSAVMLDDTSDDPALPVPPPSIGGEISWTRSSLTSFWEFLFALREAGNLGPLSLSFHASAVPRTPPSDDSPSASASVSAREPSQEDSIYGSYPDANVCRMPLKEVDHIKIYHDVGHAMALRNVLDAWSYVVASKEGGLSHQRPENEAKRKDNVKVRLLRGARLVLVDERSKGVLTC